MIQCEESIVSLQCGRVSSESFDEIVVCTYTGWVFALSTEPVEKPRKDALTTLAPHLEVKIQQVRLAIEKLKRGNEKRRLRHQAYKAGALSHATTIAMISKQTNLLQKLQGDFHL
uniref:BBS7 beta-propeller domain-containing protein n=1 Tax=Parascaris equorum TaxID=6256 RepID=A0A914RM29_PAREQ